MKKFFVIILVVILLLSLSACAEKKTTIERQTFQNEVHWELAAERQEQIILKEIEYTNTYYRAKISGNLFYNADNNPNLYQIPEQEVEFRQEQGAIWSSIISVEKLGVITIYAHRLGEEYIPSDQECQFDNFVMTTDGYKSYKHINFLFYSNQMYLLFDTV
ncbi:MAG: hypothetical protein NC350_02220 [Corallococcus sp.]|nr:hypothetical protein [Corallococcus sp.]